MRKIYTLLLLTMMALLAKGQTTKLVIGGDVYGGGKEGAVGTGYAQTKSTDPTLVTLKEDSLPANGIPRTITQITIHSCDSIRTLFGGGENGRTYGGTSLTVTGESKVGFFDLKGTTHGGIFGGGDGKQALVFGNSEVVIKGGQIAQNVYGGGNEANLIGHTKVHLLGGDIRARGVFGGARMADIYGYSYVFIDGQNLRDSLVVNSIYGGNDVSGDIETSVTWEWTKPTCANMALPFNALNNTIDGTWNAFVRTTNPDKEDGTGMKVFIGQVYGGGDGSYDYQLKEKEEDDDSEVDEYEVTIPSKVWDDTDSVFVESNKTYTVSGAPTLPRTYLELCGGTIAHVYGGGNAATVTDNTTICINNKSAVVTSIYGAEGTNILADNTRLAEMGLNTFQTHTESDQFQFARVFGGNNKADMAIMPKWDLRRGAIRDLYSGGNEGRMTSTLGLLLEIPDTSNIVVDNLYGGCRRANVCPGGDEANPDSVPNLMGYHFPGGLSARVLVRGGDINNVYGGNDISGRVYGGNAVGVYHTIRGNIYGGGNGSYAYTDNAELGQTDRYRDYYYDVDSLLGKPANSSFTSLESATALNAFRPNAEQVSIRVAGKPNLNEAGDTVSFTKTIIHGSIYCGGNSATLKKSETKSNPLVELKMGSHVIADNVFLGNNGVNMVDTTNVLKILANSEVANYSQMKLKEEPATFAKYMEGAAMDMVPSVTFDIYERDSANYIPYSSMIGSIFCGGNVGSMTYAGKNTMNFNVPIYVYDKVVGGCNDAYVPASKYNAAYFGGIRGTDSEQANYTETVMVDGKATTKIKDRLVLNFDGLQIKPMTWNADSTDLVWHYTDMNTVVTEMPDSTDTNGNPVVVDGKTLKVKSMDSTPADLNRRFTGGNIYAGCFNSGQVNGNVVININKTINDRDILFDKVAEDSIGEAIYYNNYYTDEAYKITERRTGVILGQQGMDVLGSALNVFGGGYGEYSEVWGSATINVKGGYVFQIFGGGEKGTIGKRWNGTSFDSNPVYNPDYSTCINLHGNRVGVSKLADSSPLMAECEFIYGGGFEGLILGDTRINLGNGRVFNTFAGSCNADILGHTETYIGSWPVSSDSTATGFPWIRDHLYGGNDLGGKIMQEGDFADRVRSNAVKNKIYNKNTDLLKGSAYIEYTQGRVDAIFGGSYGYYDYKDMSKFSAYTNADGSPKGSFKKPHMTSAFVHIRPDLAVEKDSKNTISRIYGAAQGYPGESYKDSMQQRSYVLIDIPDSVKRYKDVEVFGGGAFGGVGMSVNAATVTDTISNAAVVDLIDGQIDAAYGASHHQGITRRSIVNVPTGSSIQVNNLFGGAYGDNNAADCDAYEAIVNYSSRHALVKRAIYGGNNKARRTLYGQVNINDTVFSDRSKGYQATVYGAGLGKDTWSQYTEVNLNRGAVVNEAYGGGNAGKVLNKLSVDAWAASMKALKDEGLVADTLWTYLGGCVDNGLENSLVHATVLGQKYNTNVHIHEGATVTGYCYGAGLGADAVVSGTSYIDLLGGTVVKDLYAAGTSGDVRDLYRTKKFVASANAYILGGSARNVYGGGWKGSVGYHDTLTVATTTDIPGVTNIIIGKTGSNSFLDGDPAIQRNAYAGGEGGAVYGKAQLTINNGHIGYVYTETKDEETGVVTGQYEEKLDDETWNVESERNGRLNDCGNVFGGGYDDNSSVDSTDVKIWGGVIRGSLFGGGEIATIGRGAAEESGSSNKERKLKGIYKYGKTHIEMYSGHVRRNVFGGGKGYNLLGYGGVNKRYTDGYVFGQTEVFIRGGEIGTLEGVDEGYGNVFGGGDVGFVYGVGKVEKTEANSTGSPGHYYYYKYNLADGEYEDKDGHKVLSEDCKVVVEPWTQVKTKWKDITLAVNNDLDQTNDEEVEVTGVVTIGGHDYLPGQYVPTDTLNTLKSKNDISNIGSDVTEGSAAYNSGLQASDRAKWAKLDDTGIIIHNAIFGGGNVSAGSDKVYANATTVFGNVTATLRDIYHRDLITVGYEHTGGLYGGGNLSLVDGYREIHVSNYGTDYYGLTETITLEEYYRLTDREKAYFRLRYKCLQDIGSYTDADGIYHKAYKEGDLIYQEEYEDQNDMYQNEDYWAAEGFCSIYAGRLLNTIQRADLCGVFGSRMVLMGARDRVTDVVDYTRYTINRVGELSLNQQRSEAGDTDPANQLHGNYFGIYSVVNCLGNLTSDVRFDDPRTTENDQTESSAGSTPTYWEWKKAHRTGRVRNIGTSYNQVALASGVFLEITTEKSTAQKKDYGLITGIVELDLINATVDEVGGGYVYAKNEHGKREESGYSNVTLSPYNSDARTYKLYTYNESVLDSIQTSGNFIHGSKRIIDDCYPHMAEFTPGTENYSEAHYWFVKGTLYIYDQIVSAYTGSANSYYKQEQIPLTITPGSHGRLTLMNVQPSLYAYWKDAAHSGKLLESDSVKVDKDTKTFGLNDVITYWDYSQLDEGDKSVFEPATMVSVAAYTRSEESTDTIQIGDVMLPSSYAAFRDGLQSKTIIVDGKSVTIQHPLYDVKHQQWVEADKIYRSSNNMSREKGYVLTFEMNSPKDWDKWYTPVKRSDGATINTTAYAALETHADSLKYLQGPTFHTTATENLPYGQRQYERGEVIPQNVVDNYPTSLVRQEGQAVVVEAYAVKSPLDYSYTVGEQTYTGRLNPGTAISDSLYKELKTHISGIEDQFERAQVCIHTVELGDNVSLYLGDVVTSVQVDSLIVLGAAAYMLNPKFPEKDTATDSLAYATSYARGLLSAYLLPAYYCQTAGLYGGKIFDKDNNFSSIESWNSFSYEDRQQFEFNNDAFDLLADSLFRGRTTGPEGGLNDDGELYRYGEPYCKTYSVEYSATYQGDTPIIFTKKNDDGTEEEVTVSKNTTLSNKDYEEYIANEQYHFTPIKVGKTPVELRNNVGENGEPVEAGEDYYIVKKRFVRADIPYEVGEVISAGVYRALTQKEREDYVLVKKFLNETDDDKHYDYYFYCRENFEVGEKGGYEGRSNALDSIRSQGVLTDGKYIIEKGTIIPKEYYTKLPNYQRDFLIKGMEPTETATLYVSRESDIDDLSKERIYTVIYQYTYNESDDTGESVELVNELHIINVHVQFKSGVPSVGTLPPPPLVLPGSTVGLKEPRPIVPGAYEIMGGGWEVYDNRADAESHRNGQPYTPNETQMYWYQNQKHYVAYYALTYLGKTYSNAVPFSVANYHDLGEVMADKAHHMYVDYDPAKLDRDCKIYINDSLKGLAQLTDFINLSYDNSSKPTGHSSLADYVKGGNNLEFILRTDLKQKTPWTPIANNTGECFEGILHGDGHYVSGLDKSLFRELCGDIYNLGVTGSFTGGGVADTGKDCYIENSWVATTETPAAGVKAVLGQPTGTGIQLVNCYYPETNAYTAGAAIKMPAKSFCNGEVAYNLNGFYLNKRYYDQTQSESDNSYSYLQSAADGTLPQDVSKGHYPNEPEAKYGDIGYVERRYSDGDYRYAGGTIPETDDIRQRTKDNATVFAPIWPDDYIFFGQTLNYGHDNDYDHQDYPSAIFKSGGRMLTAEGSNRVYRAPAYFGSDSMAVAFFNPNAVFAATKKDDTQVEAYRGMTAIDFTGWHDKGWQQGDYQVPAGQANAGQHYFYPPLLDDAGLTGFTNVDLTKNLLVYTGTATTASAMTHAVVGRMLPYETYSEMNSKYHTVDYRDPDAIRGHWVQQQRNKEGQVTGYVANNDHLLVDRQDFNAPIAYDFAAGRRMWYQREPANYVDRTKGWEVISLPFKADTVTTSQKGEITHFYEGSTTGHEYWLREFGGNVQQKEGETETGVYTADFNHPAAGSIAKEVTNTFLWDYYYEAVLGHNHRDLMGDEYQTYYNQSRTYENYPRLAAATPYLIGFPGPTYYEFDLSGEWTAKTTASMPAPLDPQIITFASAPAEHIGVSDEELQAVTPTGSKYNFMPNYKNQELPADTYVMDSLGASFRKLSADASVNKSHKASRQLTAFRPYMTYSGSSVSGAPTRSAGQIVFGSGESSFGIEEHGDPSQGDVAENMAIYAKRHKVVVTSSLRTPADVRIFNASGLCVANFTVEPGQTVETPIYSAGIYIVHAAGGRYRSKLAVK